MACGTYNSQRMLLIVTSKLPLILIKWLSEEFNYSSLGAIIDN